MMLRVFVIAVLVAPPALAEVSPMAPEFHGRKADLSQKGAPLRDVLASIVAVGNANIIIDVDIGGNVDVEAHGEEWDKLLMRVTAENALSVDLVNHVFVVSKRGLTDTARTSRRAGPFTAPRVRLVSNGAPLSDVLRLLALKGAPIRGNLPADVGATPITVSLRNVPSDLLAVLLLDSAHAIPSAGEPVVAKVATECSFTDAPLSSLKVLAIVSGDVKPLALLTDGKRVDVVAKDSCISSDKKRVKTVTPEDVNVGGDVRLSIPTR
jgi:hypothetical protein